MSLILDSLSGLISPEYKTHKRLAKQWGGELTPKLNIDIVANGFSLKEILKITILLEKSGQEMPLSELKHYKKLDVDIQKSFEAYWRLHNAKVFISKKKEKAFKAVLNYAQKGLDLDDMVNVMIDGKNAGLEFILAELQDFQFAHGSVSEAIDLIKEAFYGGIDLTFGMLTEHLRNRGKMEAQIRSWVKLRQSQIDVNLEDIRKFASRSDIELIANCLVKVHNNNLAISKDDLLNYANKLDLAKAVNIVLKIERAGQKINFGEIWNYSTARDIEELSVLLPFVRSTPELEDISINDLKAFPKSGDVSMALKSLIKAKKAGFDLKLKDFTEYYTIGGSIKDLVSSAIKLKDNKIDVSINDLKELFKLYNSTENFNLVKAVDLIIKCQDEKISLSFDDLRNFLAKNGDLVKLDIAMITANQENLNLSFADLQKVNEYGGNLVDFVKAITISKKEDLGYNKIDFLKFQVAQNDVISLVRALRIYKRENFEIERDEIEKVYREGLDILKLMYSLINAINSGLDIDFNYAVAIERAYHNALDDDNDDTEKEDIDQVVKWALQPKTHKLEPFTVVSKDGIELIIKAEVKVKGKIKQYFAGAREEIVFDLVRIAIISEMVNCENHREIRENRNRIALDVKEKLSKDDFNKNSALEIIDVAVPIVEIGKDTNAELRERQAELDKKLSFINADKKQKLLPIREKEAEINFKNREAEKERDIGIAFREGSMSSKEYYKYKSNKK